MGTRMMASVFAATVLAFGLVVGLAPDLRADSFDFGDAPDPSFPSLLASSGPHHLDVTKQWLGPGNSITTTELNSWQPDGDVDDNTSWWVRTADSNNVTRTWFVTKVSYDPTKSSAAAPLYLNVLGDLDGNGTWDGGNEWAVQNLRVPLEALPQGTTTLTVYTRVSDDIAPADMVAKVHRVTLSDTTVNTETGASGAWGAFSRGETEDWIGGAEVGGVVGTPTGPLFSSIKTPTAPVLVGAANGFCDICEAAGMVTPLHGTLGDPSPEWAWTLNLPATTTHLMVKLVEFPGDDAQALCAADSYLDLGLLWDWVHDPVWGCRLPLNTLSGDLINHGPLPPGGANTFTETAGLVSNTGHTGVRFFYGIVYDPDPIEYVYVWNWTDLEYNVPPVPEPAALGLVGLALLALRKRRS